MRSSAAPPSTKSTRASLKPGSTAPPLASIIVVCGRLRREISRSDADAQDLVAADGDRFRHAAGAVGGIDPCVVDDQVHRAVAVVALCADDEAGDQR